MCLCIDVGNTNIVLGVYREEDLLFSWRISTDRQKTSDEFGLLFCHFFEYGKLPRTAVTDAVICSVVPPITGSIEAACRNYFEINPMVMGSPDVDLGINILYDNPKEVGADRLANAIGAYSRYGGPAIVVDFGTATTFDAVGEDGSYLGGAIAPGIGISTEALFLKAAKLPRIDLVRPKRVIAKDTVSSMQAGIVYGFAGQVDAIVTRMKAELGSEPTVIATGGLAELISKETTTIEKVDQLLTLEGLRIVWLRNRGR
ncbi:MAG TPA: type III pantothenate kinase [Clostridia bacterium]|nr:type III pantothenate kinase [Clostridia bacterium]